MNLPSLARVLRWNALYSIATGGVAAAAHVPTAMLLAVPPGLVIAIGVSLIGFGLAVAWYSEEARATARVGLVVAAADALWVVSMALFVGVVRLPPAGRVLVVATSVPVAVFAVLQALASRRDQPRVRRIEMHRVVRGTPDAIWDVMTDHQLYAKLAPNLSRVGPFMPTGEGEGSGRRCWDTRGRHWDEKLASWEPGRSFSVDVDTRAESYPYPVDEMQGSWSVTPVGPDRSRVTMLFTVRPRRGAAGRAFASALTIAGPPMMRRIIAGWESEVASRQESPLRPRT